MNLRQLFLSHVAQTSPAPLAIEIVKAEGSLLWDAEGREYIDLIGGISVANTGHRHPHVVRAVKEQLDAYMHVMVYGEFVQSPQVRYAHLLTRNLPSSLNSVYFTNSGAEAVEGAMKLAKRVTGRCNILCFENSYHGSTQGALSMIGSEYWRNSYRPLLPGIRHLQYNSASALDAIDKNTACVVMETIQAEAGILAPREEWIRAVRERCTNVGALLVLDEIQAGFGRTGRLWGFEHFNVVPDLLLAGKALGGGMPLGAFIAPLELMAQLTADPVLGHITTFGGHPVSCAAGRAALEVLLENDLPAKAAEKSRLFVSLLEKSGRPLSHFGLWMALDLDNPEYCKEVVDRCIGKGLITDWFLFAPHCLRISPPLTLSNEEIERSAEIILSSL